MIQFGQQQQQDVIGSKDLDGAFYVIIASAYGALMAKVSAHWPYLRTWGQFHVHRRMDQLEERRRAYSSTLFPASDNNSRNKVDTYILYGNRYEHSTVDLFGHHLQGNDPLNVIRRKLQQLDLPAPREYQYELGKRRWTAEVPDKRYTSTVYLTPGQSTRPRLFVERKVMNSPSGATGARVETVWPQGYSSSTQGDYKWP